jgi:hypothetical protein
MEWRRMPVPIARSLPVRRPRRLVLGVWVLIGCRPTPDSGTPHTTVLPPAAEGEAFEPSIALDPNDADRIVVAAQYGVPFARGGKGIWIWRSADGGRSWTHGRLDPPRFPDVADPPTFSVDVVTAFGVDGTPLLASKSDLPPLGGTFLSRLGKDSLDVTSVGVYRNFVDSAAERRVLHDKPWLAVDHGARSPYRGSIYLSVAAITAGLGAAGPGVDWKLYSSNELLAVSRDGGRTFSTPREVAGPEAFGGAMVVAPDGTLELTYMRIKTRDSAGDTIFHVRSRDGGATFEPPVIVAATPGDTLLNVSSLAVRPDGSLLSCWSQGFRADERTNDVHCATRRPGAAWSTGRSVRPALPPGVVPAWPAMVGTERGWYLMLYLAGESRTEVALFRSADGAAFTQLATLASAEGLGVDRFCLMPSTPCRRTRTDGFAIGDYVTLTAAGGRLAAAYVLPRPGRSPGDAAIHVTTLDEPVR